MNPKMDIESSEASNMSKHSDNESSEMTIVEASLSSIMIEDWDGESSIAVKLCKESELPHSNVFTLYKLFNLNGTGRHF